MASTRLIDLAPAPENRKEIQLLCFGFSRTGTMSLKTALTSLGYTPYHCSEAVINCRENHLLYWNEAFDAKFEGKGQPYTKEDFDKFLWKYDALEDIPSILFVDELLKAYPDAKVILTNRDPESWLVSMNRTFYTVFGWRTLPLLCAWDTLLWGPYASLIRKIVLHWTKGNPSDREALKKTYLEHYAHVRELVPKARLLEFKSQDGWGPLCEFLGKPVPEGPYPRTNDAATTQKIHSYVYYLRIWQMSKKPLGAIAAAGIAVGLGYWWYK